MTAGAATDSTPAAQKEERRRIARDIHDHLGQQVTALRMHLEILRAECAVQTVFCQRVMKLEQLAQPLDMSVDLLTRYLRPPVIDPVGFSGAVERLIEDWSERFGIAAAYCASSGHTVDATPDMATHLYYILQEALHNVVKHARANCVSVSLSRHHGSTVLLIEDDGQGFDPSARPVDSEALGLISMRERAALAWCEFEVASTPGRGTTISIR